MEYVGRQVKKKFKGHGTFLGLVKAYDAETGFLKIVYDDGDSEELELTEVSSLLMPAEPQPSGSSAGRPGRKPKKRRRIGVSGDDVENSADGAISDGLEGRDGESGEFDLNLTERIDLNDDGVDCLRNAGHANGGGSKLHGLDLNELVNLELNKEIVEDGSQEGKKMIDLNLDVNEGFEKLSDERGGRCFDLNLQLMEDEVRILEGCDARLGEGDNGCSRENEKMEEGLVVEDDAVEVLENGNGDDKVDHVVHIDKEDDSQLKNHASVVDSENVASLNVQVKRRGRKKKNVSNNITELATQLDNETGNVNLELERRDETPLKNVSGLVDHDNEVSETVLSGRRGRRKREPPNNEVTLTTPETGLRRSSRRAKRAALSDLDQVLNEAELVGINQQLSSPAISNVSQERVTVAARGKISNVVALPEKVKLPPPSCDMNLVGVSLFDLVSVYTFLRSFSTLLFLSPFKLNDFVASVKCSDSSSLFDFIHVSLLKTLQKHLETLAAEGFDSASDCLRSLNWDFLDLITWPMYVVEYLLLHSPGHIPGLDLCQLKFFQNDYYKLPISAKVKILQHLCDDVIETEAFKLELNRRILTTDRQTDLDRKMKLESSRKRKTTVDVASTSCITGEGDGAEDPADWNSDECCLCKMDGDLICCDGCPAAFHSRCVGVVSSMLPEGDWYCPECVIERDKPWMKVSKSTRGAELLGFDPYGRLYYSSCGYLFVLESCNDEYMFCAYNRNDLTTLIEALESSPFIYDKLINAICKNWNVSRGSCGAKNDLDTRSCSIQSVFPEKGQMPDMLMVPSESIIRNGSSKKTSDEKSMVTTYSSNEENLNSERVTAMVEICNHGLKMENHLASSEGSAEVSQTSMKIDNPKESVLECTKTCFDPSDCCDIPEKLINAGDHDMASTSLNFEEGKSLKPYSMNSNVEVGYGTNYMNCYEFARTASDYYQEYSRKSSDKTSGDAPRSIEEVLAGQLKIVSNRFVEFSWSNIQNSNMTSRKERCGWCVYCRVPGEERDCLFSMNDSIPAVEKFSHEVLGIPSQMNVKNHLINIMCHIICMEDHLQGLLLGPWLNPDYSMLWHASVRGATDIALLKNLLLQLASNLHHLALSADWRKHVDSVATVGSATHIVSTSARASAKHGISRKRAKSSDVSGPSSNAATGLSLFWWRGGRGSRTLFSWKVLPHSLASKAARQGGRKKIPGILYPESGDYAKRTKYDSWRASVETSRSVEQLALQVREMDANIRWDDIGNNKLFSKIEMDSKKPARSFKKVIIRRKCSEGAVVRYLLDFGKRRFIPDVVVKHGSKLEDSSNERKRYWLEESHVPLHLLKAFEEKRIARKSNTMKSGKLSESSRVMKKPLKEKGFSYLFSRAERVDYYQCAHCEKDVLIREAVSCQHCKGFFHKRHVRNSAGYITTQCKYTCHKCQDLKVVKVDTRKGKSESTKLKKASKSVKLLRSGRGRKRGKGKLLVNSINKKGVSVAPLRRSARNAERTAKIPMQNSKLKKRKRGRKPKPEKYKSMKPKAISRKKQRTAVTSSYWLNGLRLSRKPGDERHLRNRKLLVLSGEVDSILNETKCSLCHEVEHNSELNYVGCEICGDWFHGDALDLGAEKIENLIGFRCHMCLNKPPPFGSCSLGENSKPDFFPENNAKTECNEGGPYCLANPEDGLAYQKTHLDDKSIDTLATVNMEKQLQGSVPESDLKDKDLEMAEKTF
ncbi:DDT domain-containing protein PTM [Salvia splendens]|uniref:DDT domain-containing protein PTM n=1 Tax=Salvia splendens TaxID=180675 RepID=UPI001C26E4FE|nr:DDT domain-containing protein PTM [Salvia splendens]